MKIKKKIKKLNLGCGNNLKQGYINVDKYGNPDKKIDLEKFPWPWKDNSIDEVLLIHVLEHLGESTKIYLKIIQELYRICKPNAKIIIHVPHPRHDTFLNDPTHVRIITPNGLSLFSQKENLKWKANNIPNTTLGLFLDVDFEIIDSTYILEPEWEQKLQNNEISEDEIYKSISRYNNVVIESHITLKVIKDI